MLVEARQANLKLTGIPETSRATLLGGPCLRAFA